MADDQLFADFIRNRGAALYRYGYLLTGSHHDADDLILSIHEDHGARDVVERLQDLDKARPIATGGFVVASLSLPELVRHILPVTNLADLLRLARNYGMEALMLALANGVYGADFAWQSDEPERRREHNARFEWFLKLLAGVVWSASEPVGASPDDVFEWLAHEERVAASVAEMVGTATVDRQRPRRDAASRADAIVDRRRRYPVAAVTTNRPASGEATRSRATVEADAAERLFSVDTAAIGTGYRPTSISDPGNADAVITVGSTHRSDPHRHGVSYFSGRGPTADGRPKPDLLAPGEDIDGPIPEEGLIAMHGTSQAAAHVSGAAAMLMARHRELVGRPERVKQILCATATDLARERAFQGHGLVDVLRALQSV